MKKLLIATSMSLPLLLLAAWQAFFSPNIEFLRPSLTAAWIVHPALPTSGFFETEYHSPDVVFRRHFEIEAPAGSFAVRVTTLGVAAVELNGRKLASNETGESRNWKFGREFELGPFLKHGSNVLSVRVAYENGPPALLLEAGGRLGGTLETDDRWRAALEEDRGRGAPAAVVMRDEAFLAGKQNFLRRSAYFPLYALTLGLLALLIVYALVPVRFKPWLEHAPESSQPSTFLGRHALAAIIFTLVAISQLRNAIHFDWQSGMADATSHLGYALYVLQTWQVPFPQEASQAYHPPLFYFLAASVGAVAEAAQRGFLIPKSIQLLNATFGLLNILCSWLLLNKLFPNNVSARNLGFSVAAFLPVGFYVNPNITNEVLSGSLVSLAIYLSCVFLFGRSLNWKSALGIGFVCGLCLLSKYTGLFVFVSIASLLALRTLSEADSDVRLRTAGVLALFLAVVVAISGWFYLRNFVHYGDPFIGNWDSASGFRYEQPPGYRPASFYVDFGSLFWHIPERVRWSGFWEAIYGSLWMDVPGYLVAPESRGRDSLGSVILWLALLPSVGIVVGFLSACRHLLQREWNHPFFIAVTTSFWTLMSVMLFTLETPYYSTAKAVFLLSLIPAIAAFAGLGLDGMCRRLGRLRFLLYANLAGLYGSILYLFSVR
ncbi:MAG: glycosyltransferase family 39 protein [Deltaproteobacteria bacterium]|nr:glycosyltransferase family 39 protein [Deltaproteobacteria bacterium]MBW2398141.1 glycosyltransferase family 39 protein [Deltaproteobacteria bacterium]MBW2665177.1 glycosyltransferase family 39 protein [Deltaproteobacteria bacterium]